jgi:CheY-like chemotaxis protein
MDKAGPIIIIEDDIDDQELLREVINSTGISNQLCFFATTFSAYDYLINSIETPFIILSDVNIPGESGLQLKSRLENNIQIRLKYIPFVFFTASADPTHIKEAYARSFQGFFIKPYDIHELKRVMGNIINYWKDCISPLQ